MNNKTEGEVLRIPKEEELNESKDNSLTFSTIIVQNTTIK